MKEKWDEVRRNKERGYIANDLVSQSYLYEMGAKDKAAQEDTRAVRSSEFRE